MRSLFQSLFGKKPPDKPAAAFVQTAPNDVFAEGAAPFPLARTLRRVQDFPLADWDAIGEWVGQLDEAHRNDAWKACERGWLMHLIVALGGRYELVESPNAFVVSTLDPAVTKATVQYVERTLTRIIRTLDGLARGAEIGKEILVVFDGEDTYYRYVSIHHRDGEFATSGGMYLGQGCGHFVTTKADLREIEPVIAHEMTHACLGHLPLPLWLNEGLAVNTEARLCGRRSLYTPQEMHGKHVAFWTATRMQAFWSGEAFHTPGDDSMLAYDLGRVMVEVMASDWATFRSFALDASAEDAGAASARRHLGVDLGEYACALVEQTSSPQWSPDPARWRLNAGATSPSCSRSARAGGRARSPR